MAEPTVQLLLRVSPELKKQIEDAAKDSQRSINFEAVQRLERSFALDKKRQYFNTLHPNELPNSLIEETLEVLSMLKDVIEKKD